LAGTEPESRFWTRKNHSGIPVIESIKGFAQKDLAAQGGKGGVIGLVYITAFLIAAGGSVASIWEDVGLYYDI
jgi:hypothetical protein